MQKILYTVKKNIKRMENSRDSVLKILMTSPVILFTLTFLFYPIISSFIISFQKFDGIHKPTFNGFQNFIILFTTKEFSIVLFNNLYLALLIIPLSIIIPIVLAVFLFDGTKFQKYFRAVFLLPSVISLVIVGILFRTLFGYYGPFNKFLELIGFGSYIKDWISHGINSLPIIAMAFIWSLFGVRILFYVNAISSISSSIYESAKMDGVNWLQRLLHITIPMIIPIIEFTLVMSVFLTFSDTFNFVYTMTSGGPGYESTTFDYLIYQKGFYQNNFGYASATAVVLFLLILLAARFIRFYFKKTGDWQ